MSSSELLYVNLAHERIQRALRQERRTQQAWASLRDEHIVSGEMPASWVELNAVFNDHVYFLVLSTNQALKARAMLEARGHTVPFIGQAAAIAAWRNISEHWDDPPLGKPIRAARHWQSESDETEPGLSHSGADELETISGVKIPQLRRDLIAVLSSVEGLSEALWERTFLPAEDAARFLGMSSSEFDLIRGQLLTIDFPDSGERFHLDWLEARRDGVPPPKL